MKYASPVVTSLVVVVEVEAALEELTAAAEELEELELVVTTLGAELVELVTAPAELDCADEEVAVVDSILNQLILKP